MDKGRRTRLHIKPEQHNVAVLHNVLLALGADKALFLGGGHRAAGHQVVERDDLRADEAALKVAVNLAGSLRCFGAAGDGPCADLRFACGEVGDESEQVVASLDQTVQTGFCLLYTSPSPRD